MIRRFLILGFLWVALYTPTYAADVVVRPFLIDEVVAPREIMTRDVLLKNDANHKINAYATVNEITLDVNGEIKDFVPAMGSDRTESVTSWIEITRGRIELMPGEEKTVPLTFRIHPNPKPGTYYAFIGFGSAAKRFEAEAQVMRGDAQGVVVKLTIADETVESLRITSLSVDRFILDEADESVAITLENSGDVPAIPEGELIFYSNTGEELFAMPVNVGRVAVPPGETTVLEAPIPENNRLGRIKANVSLQYGERQRATLYDSVQFFMIPLPYLVGLLLLILSIASLTFWLVYRAVGHRPLVEHGEVELPLYVRDGHDPNPKDHDIDLSKTK